VQPSLLAVNRAVLAELLGDRLPRLLGNDEDAETELGHDARRLGRDCRGVRAAAERLEGERTDVAPRLAEELAVVLAIALLEPPQDHMGVLDEPLAGLVHVDAEALARARWVECGVGEGTRREAAFCEGDAIEDRAGADTEQWSNARRFVVVRRVIGDLVDELEDVALPVSLDVFAQGGRNRFLLRLVTTNDPRLVIQPVIDCEIGRHHAHSSTHSLTQRDVSERNAACRPATLTSVAQPVVDWGERIPPISPLLFQSDPDVFQTQFATNHRFNQGGGKERSRLRKPAKKPGPRHRPTRPPNPPSSGQFSAPS
jgi:hypothetical protein